MPATHLETLYWGLKFSEWLSLIGLLLGPVVAVVITLWIEGRRRKIEQRTQILRMLLTTRHLPSDAVYSAAINLIPIEFNEHPAIMSAWHNYIEVVRYRPTEENRDQHNLEVNSRQTKLIFETMRAMGFKLSETDIQTSAYVSEGFIQRDRILLGSQLAMAEIAASLKEQTALISKAAPADSKSE